MPIVEERLASLEARMQRIEDLFMLVVELRDDMTRQFAGVNRQFADVNRRFDDVNRQFIDVRSDAHRDFRWIVGIQLTTMATVIGALVGVLSRQ
jgi:hypothetical protein